MISTNKKRFSKKLIVTAGLVALFIAGSLTYVYALGGNLLGWQAPNSSPSDNNKINYGPATSEQQKSGSKIKSDSTNNQQDPAKPATNQSDTPPAPTPTPDSAKKSVQVTITAANQNGSILQIRTQIDAVENTGKCTLTLTKSGASTVTKTAGTQAYASISTCQGFDIPMSELSAGTWQALINFDSSTLTGSATKTITLQ